MGHLASACALAVCASVAACGDSGSGAGGKAATVSSSSSSAVETVTVVGSASTSSSGQGGGGCIGAPAAIPSITHGDVPVGTRVELAGVVVMSPKWLVSGKSHCLWGVFLSAPNLFETSAGTGLLAASYGADPTIAPGGRTPTCPKLGAEPTGDEIPDDVAPGDVIDVVGLTDYFPSTPMCATPSPPNQVPMRLLTSLCAVKRKGAAAVPRPHLLTGTDVASLVGTTDHAFHDAWGGVKVELDGLPIVPQGAPPVPVSADGTIVLSGNIPALDRIYAEDYAAPADICHQPPTYKGAVSFVHVRGFHYLDGCAWSLLPEDKCVDLAPPSNDCGVTTCY